MDFALAEMINSAASPSSSHEGAAREPAIRIRLLAWRNRSEAIFGVSWRDPATGQAIALNVIMEADPERLARARTLPDHVRRDVLEAARALAAGFARLA